MVSSIRFDSTVNTFGDLVNEVFSGTTEWETTRIKLDCAYYDFGFLEVNLADIISKS